MSWEKGLASPRAPMKEQLEGFERRKEKGFVSRDGWKNLTLG